MAGLDRQTAGAYALLDQLGAEAVACVYATPEGQELDQAARGGPLLGLVQQRQLGVYERLRLETAWLRLPVADLAQLGSRRDPLPGDSVELAGQLWQVGASPASKECRNRSGGWWALHVYRDERPTLGGRA